MIVEVCNLYIKAQLSVNNVISQRQMQIVLTSHCGWICQERNPNVIYACGKETLLLSGHMLIMIGQWGDPIPQCRDEWVACALNKPALRTLTPPSNGLDKRLLTSMKLQILFCLIFFLYLCSWTLFLTDTLKSHGHPQYQVKPIPDHLFPQEIRPPTFFLPAIALSILTLQGALLTTLGLTTLASRPFYSVEFSNPLSRFGQLRYVFVKKIFFVLFSQSNLSPLPTSRPLDDVLLMFSPSYFRYSVLLQSILQT